MVGSGLSPVLLGLVKKTPLVVAGEAQVVLCPC
jgi:hypothetical protein